MYSSCIFCRAPLGSNADVEAFPVGSQIAFDAAKGRLWAICPRCLRWSLSPLEERWEALEECERLFGANRQRFSTGEIGIAQLPSGLRLVRIGAPPRLEFAAWRYGSLLQQRRSSALASVGLAVAFFGGLSMIGPGAHFLGVTAALLATYGWMWYEGEKGPSSKVPPFKRVDPYPYLRPHRTFLRLDPSYPDGWAIAIGTSRGSVLLMERDAVQFLRFFLPFANRVGGSDATIQHAVSELELVERPGLYFAQAELSARKLGAGYRHLSGMPPPVLLALEMAANEETEQAALTAELTLLRQAWKEAEETAAIADRLLLPSQIESRLRELS